MLCIAPEPMVPKVLINQDFSFGEVTKTVTDMKEHLDDICKKEMDNLSRKGDKWFIIQSTNKWLCQGFFFWVDDNKNV